jgi:uncharacterized small protein (DUF1192 family)
MEPTIAVISSTQLRVTTTTPQEEIVDRHEIETRIASLEREIVRNNANNQLHQNKITQLQDKLRLFERQSVLDDISRLNEGATPRGDLGEGESANIK